MKSEEWASWDPTITSSGSMTASAITKDCKYFRSGKLCYFTVRIGMTLGGSASNTISISLPFSIRNPGSFPASILSVSAYEAGTAYIATGGSNLISVRRYNAAAYTLGSGNIIIASGVYETS